MNAEITSGIAALFAVFERMPYGELTTAQKNLYLALLKAHRETTRKAA